MRETPKRLWWVKVATSMLLIGSLAAQTHVVSKCGATCAPVVTDAEAAVTVEELADCEKEKLAKAEATLEKVKEEIMIAHGKETMNYNAVWYGNVCQPTTYRTFALTEGVVLIKKQTISSCAILTSPVTIR